MIGRKTWRKITYDLCAPQVEFGIDGLKALPLSINLLGNNSIESFEIALEDVLGKFEQYAVHGQREREMTAPALPQRPPVCAQPVKCVAFVNRRVERQVIDRSVVTAHIRHNQLNPVCYVVSVVEQRL